MLPIPPVPTDTAKAIRESLAGTVQPFAAQQNRIRALTCKVLDHRAKAAASQKRIVELEDEKEQGLRDIRETRQRETADIVAAVERKLRSRYNKEAAAAQALWKEKLEEECDAKRKAWREQQQQQKEDQLTVSSSHEGEPDKKRTKLDEEEQESENLANIVVSNDNNSTLEMVSTTPRDISSVAPTKEAEKKKKSDVLREQLTESEAALEKLTETRAEMIWLLKQVIKADEKLNKPSAPTTTTSSQKR